MKKIIVFMMMVFFSSLAYCQSIPGMSKDEVIQQAKEIAESSNPPMDSSHMHAHAVYLPNENSWIVDFMDESPTASADSDYMLRVEASSGKSPELLRGSQKQRYMSYFQNATNNN